MRPTYDINEMIKKLKLKASVDLDRRVNDDISTALAESDKTKSAHAEPTIWRTIMKTRKARITAAAAIIVVAALSLTLFMQTATPAWAIGQTIKALQDIKTLVITGEDYYPSGSIPFKCWFRLPDQDDDLFNMRYESEKQIIVVHGTKAWAYWNDENLVMIYEDVTESEDMMRDLEFWYKIARRNPWITGKILPKLRLFADDWQEIYGKDKRTGRDCVFVTCSYESLSNSFWFECDLENKLIIEGKYWRSDDHKGPPVLHATDFLYNEAISDEIFNFQIPDGAEVIHREKQKEAEALFLRGEELFQQDKFAEAINVFQDVYEKYPDFKILAARALRQKGLCYERTGQFEKAIESYKKCIEEVPPNLKAWTAKSYLFLGRVYVQINRKAEALEALKNCLTIGSEVRDPDWPPSEEARKYIQELEKRP